MFAPPRPGCRPYPPPLARPHVREAPQVGRRSGRFSEPPWCVPAIWGGRVLQEPSPSTLAFPAFPGLLPVRARGPLGPLSGITSRSHCDSPFPDPAESPLCAKVWSPPSCVLAIPPGVPGNLGDPLAGITSEPHGVFFHISPKTVTPICLIAKALLQFLFCAWLAPGCSCPPEAGTSMCTWELSPLGYHSDWSLSNRVVPLPVFVFFQLVPCSLRRCLYPKHI